MTSLRLQNMFIADCEDLVEQGFYDWCKKWSIDSPPPDWQDAPLQVKRGVALMGYKIYEGIPQQRGNERETLLYWGKLTSIIHYNNVGGVCS